uniref:Uncharacterized protein n=1 Tax=Anguilla anguilla TaxID=7936 RepID=A0A0E9X736_ANGAN
MCTEGRGGALTLALSAYYVYAPPVRRVINDPPSVDPCDEDSSFNFKP